LKNTALLNANEKEILIKLIEKVDLMIVTFNLKLVLIGLKQTKLTRR